MKNSLLLALLFNSVASYGLMIVPTFVDAVGETWTQERKDIVNYAISDWTSVINDNYSIDMTFDFTAVGTASYLAQWAGSGNYYEGDDFMPWYRASETVGVNHSIHFNADFFDTNLSYYSWFDPTPEEASDLTSSYYDLLTVTRHEIGHALGFARSFYKTNIKTVDEVEVWMDRITIAGANATFDAGGGNIYDMAATNNLGHVKNSGLTALDLMNPALYNGQRRDISTPDLNMLETAYGYQIIPEPMAITLIAFFGTGMMLFKRLI